jgi:hypothetical protein
MILPALLRELTKFGTASEDFPIPHEPEGSPNTSPPRGSSAVELLLSGKIEVFHCLA